jgi:hypothetical protein
VSGLVSRKRERDAEPGEARFAVDQPDSQGVGSPVAGTGRRGKGERTVRFEGLVASSSSTSNNKPAPPTLSSEELKERTFDGPFPRRESPARAAPAWGSLWEMPLPTASTTQFQRRTWAWNAPVKATDASGFSAARRRNSQMTTFRQTTQLITDGGSEGDMSSDPTLPPPLRTETKALQFRDRFASNELPKRSGTIDVANGEMSPRGDIGGEDLDTDAANQSAFGSASYVAAIASEEEEAAIVMNRLDEMRAQDELLREIYREVLHSTVQDMVQTEVRGQLRNSWGLLFVGLKELIKEVAAAICPKSKGVTKALKSGASFAIPVELDEADKEQLKNLKEGSLEAVVVKGPQGDITKRHLLTCEERCWLADPVINTYFYYVEQLVDPSRVLVLNSFFFTKLKTAGYEGACRWTKKMDIFAPERVLIVINDSSHWTLAVVNNKKKRFEYYDSLGGQGLKILDLLADFWTKEYRAKKGVAGSEQFKDGNQWRRFTPGTSVPQQRNGYDCGVFCTQFGLYVAQDLPFAFSQHDMPYLRSLIQLELLNGRLLPRL